MKKILILGAGNAQMDLIQYCQESGMEVHCCSYSETDPGAFTADHFANINILDCDRIEQYFLDHKIDVIYSIGSDIAVPVFSKTAAHTQTPSLVSQETARICCDKTNMRRALKDKDFTPSFIIGNDLDSILKDAQAMKIFPAELKPADSQGQRGVATVCDERELRESFEKTMSFSRKGEAVLEEYINGDEVSVNAYLHKGEILFSFLSDREIWPGYPGGIIHRHHFPSVYEGSEIHRKILHLVQEVVRAVGLTDGPVYFQIMIQEDTPYLIEVTPRLDGCHLWRLIREATGIDLLDMTMNHLLYKDPFHRKTYSVRDGGLSDAPIYHLEFYCQAPGERADFSGFLKEDAIYRSMYYQEGETIKPVNGYMEKCAYRIYR